jgi:hypothetical protein
MEEETELRVENELLMSIQLIYRASIWIPGVSDLAAYVSPASWHYRRKVEQRCDHVRRGIDWINFVKLSVAIWFE